MSGEEDTSYRFILDKYQTVKNSDDKRISKCSQRHCNPHALFNLFTKFENDRSKQILLFLGLKIRYFIVECIAHAATGFDDKKNRGFSITDDMPIN